jgi:hypothetical protein
MHPKVKAYHKFIKEHLKIQAELKETENSWKVFSDATEEFQRKTDALIINTTQLVNSPDAALYIPLVRQGLDLMKKATAFSDHMSAYYELQKPYHKAVMEMLGKITAENKNCNALYPERTIKKCLAIKNLYLPVIKSASQKINDMQQQLLTEREELNTLYNSMNQ